MNTEEIKLIADMLTSLGATGKEAFIWWLVAKYVLHYATVVVCIGIVAAAIPRIISAINNEDKLKAIRDALQTGDRGWYAPSDHIAVLRKIAELMKK